MNISIAIINIKYLSIDLRTRAPYASSIWPTWICRREEWPQDVDKITGHSSQMETNTRRQTGRAFVLQLVRQHHPQTLTIDFQNQFSYFYFVSRHAQAWKSSTVFPNNETHRWVFTSKVPSFFLSSWCLEEESNTSLCLLPLALCHVIKRRVSAQNRFE